MKRHLTRILSVALLACAALSAHALEIKIASVAPDGSYWMQQMRAGGERIRQLTDGRVVFKFYPGGVMGTDAQVLRKIRVGQLHGGAFTTGGLAERYNGLNVYSVPLMFRSLEEVDYVRERLDPKLEKGLEQAGFISLGFSEGGFANMLSNEPVRHVDDLLRKKVWVPDGDQISYLVMDSLGLSPVVLPVTDVLTGLQTGLLDVVSNSSVGALVLQWHTKVSFRTELPVIYSMGIFAVDAGVFNRISPEDQEIVLREMKATMDELDRSSRQDNIQAEAVMQRSGVEPVTVNASDVAGWREKSESLYSEIRALRDIDGQLFDELLEHLAVYRNGAGRSPAADN
jgi:TRAP-type C4-dicarboxylate transport system substrate-binding protein